MAMTPDSAAAPDSHAHYITRERRGRRRAAMFVALSQFGLLVLVLGAWEGLTRVPWFAKNTVFDPFFISRPSMIAGQIVTWMTPGAKSIWPHLGETLVATFMGLFAGVSSGFVAGLVLAQNKYLARVLNPFIVMVNSMPRIAFVPLITMIFGLGIASKVVTSWFVVFFILFFNTYKGSLSVERELLEFCSTLGGTPRQILWRVRIPFAAAWTFAALPNAVSFALVGVVLAEFVGSNTGMGYIMILALSALDATAMFAAITLLSIVGLILVYAVRMVERPLLHWSVEFRDDA